MGSFDPRFHVKDNTVKLAEDLGSDAVRYQGNWIPHRLRPAAEEGIFFAGDSAGHCLPLTAEGIRTGLYFGLACGRELRKVVTGEQTREQALESYGSFSDSHAWKFNWMLRVQKILPRIWPPLLNRVVSAMQRRRLVTWAFGHYLRIAPPEFAGEAPRPRVRREAREAAAA